MRVNDVRDDSSLECQLPGRITPIYGCSDRRSPIAAGKSRRAPVIRAASFFARFGPLETRLSRGVRTSRGEAIITDDLRRIDSAKVRRSMAMERVPRHLRVFLSSPGDVATERAMALRVVQRLQYDPSMRGHLTVEIVAWDNPDAPIPMPATLNPQEAVNQGSPKPSECDIVVVILWTRIGTPLPREVTKADGSRYLSGTEWEYEDALQS